MAKALHWPTFAAVCLLLLSLLGNSAGQSSVVLDFQTLQHTGTGFTTVGNVYREDGFVITANDQFHSLGVWNTGAAAYTGSTALFNNSESDTILARDDGGQFNFLAIDLAPLQNPPQSGPITFRGYRDSELVATQDFQFNGASGVQHFTPSNAFRDLTEVRWYHSFPQHQFDNITVAAIGPARSLRVGIQPPNSTVILDISHMHIGTNYTVQTSFDLVQWDYAYDFTAYSSTLALYTQVGLFASSQYYRIVWTP